MMIGHARLLQDPWCFSIDKIARLTWQQVDILYLQPAVEASKKMTGTQTIDIPEVNDEMPSFEEFVVTYGQGLVGKSEAEVHAAYESFTSVGDSENGQ